jgi:methionyl-tRNA formyltransferase
MSTKKINWVFFGSSEFSVYVLNELKLHNILPDLIVTTQDKPKGRKLILTPTPVKIWAEQNNIEVIENMSELKGKNFDLFLVASFGKIIPSEIFEIPKHKTLNIHPSLLPKYRGASPIQSQILNNEQNIGVSIMQIDTGMDTGAIVIQRPLKKDSLPKVLGSPCCTGQTFVENFSEWPSRKQLEKILATEGARLFAHILPEWIVGAIDPIMQNENEATYCKKIEKKDGEMDIDLNNLEKNALQNLLKIKAFEGWPTAYFFLNKKRIIITDATLENPSTGSTNSPQASSGQAKLVILRVKPEGKSEMPFADFLRGQK